MDVVQRVKPIAKEAAENISDTNNELLDELHKVFNEQGCSDYVVVYLRLITSGQLQEGVEFYQNFIEGT
jgi:ubiquitin thioesterase protein OTUB1